MNSGHRYDYNLPWRGAIIGAVFYAILALLTACLAEKTSKLFIYTLFGIGLSITFMALAIFMVARRLAFPRVLELTNDAILFPRGFPRTQITRIAFTDIIRTRNTHMYPGFCLDTPLGLFEIDSRRFSKIESYHAVQNFICSKAFIVLPETTQTPVDWDSLWSPNPILRWKEPENYIRFRTHLATSKPIGRRILQTTWFAARCFGFFFIPWLVLKLIFNLDGPPIGFLTVLIPFCLFFALLYWLSTSHPARVNETVVRQNGFCQLSGLQTRCFKYDSCRAWLVIEREFEGAILHILVLQMPRYVIEIAFSDTDIRDRLIQIFNDKKIPRSNDLKPSWERDSRR